MQNAIHKGRIYVPFKLSVSRKAASTRSFARRRPLILDLTGSVITLAILFDTQQQDGKRTHAVYRCHGAGDCACRACS